ncbi:MAG: hypothetical protein ACFFAE_02445 [Candidatus Hodarchaeota archaeon]
MNFTRVDVFLGLLVLVILALEYQFQITTVMFSGLLGILMFLTILAIFLIWASILVYNVANIALEYSISDTTILESEMRRTRLYRTLILISSVLLLLFGTIFSVWFIPASILVIIHLFALRAAFLLLRPEENPLKN